MHQKDVIRAAWRSAGLYEENDAKLQQFLKFLDDPTQCWNEMIDSCRRSYAAYKTKLAGPILNSGDQLVRLAVIRAASDGADDEIALLEQYVASSDVTRNAVELKLIALKSIPQLDAALMQKPGLPADLRAMLATRAAATPPSPAPRPPPPKTRGRKHAAAKPSAASGD